MKTFHRYSVFIIVLCLGFFPFSSHAFSKMPHGGQGRVTFFLNIDDPLFISADFTLTMDGLDIITKEQSLPIFTTALSCTPKKNHQYYLGTIQLAAGEYHSLQMRNLAITGPVEISDNSLSIPVDLVVKNGDNFLYNLSLVRIDNGSQKNNGKNQPVFVPFRQPPPLNIDQAYVSSPATDSILAIRLDTNRVTGVYPVPGSPNYLLGDSNHNRLSILTSDDNSIKTLEMSSGSIIDSFRVPMMQHMIYMAAGTSNSQAIILDDHTNTIGLLDLNTGSVTLTQQLSTTPSYAVYARRHGIIAVSSARAQEIVLLDAGNLQVRDRFSTAGNPSAIFAHDDFLYIGEAATGNILQINLNTGRKLRRMAGNPSLRFLHDGTYLYSSMQDGTINVLSGNQLFALKKIATDGIPLEMDFSSNRKLLYATDIKNNGIVAIDITSRKVLDHIQLGISPADILMPQ